MNTTQLIFLLSLFYTTIYTLESKQMKSEYLLPIHISPQEYDIHIIPYLEIPEEKAFTFDGYVKIKFQVINATNMIRMHAYNMTVMGEGAILINLNTNETVPIENFDTSNDDKHFLSFYLQDLLIENVIYSIEFDYIGILNNDLDGFYRSSYNDSENGKTWLAATQFSPNGARRAFPCFDEPAWKAIFTLHVAYAPNYGVISNMPEDYNSPVNGKPGLEGWTWSHRKPTPIMSTFIVGFTVSQFASLLSVVSPRFSVWARRDVVTQGGYGNEVAPQILEYMENYTQVYYPLDKMDQVAIPDFAANAMENWGMINYRETALLFEEGVSTAANRQRVATVIAHETAHQWFGNLVSPAWWGYVWLKEGFARYFEYHALHDSLEKEWQLDEQFVHSEMRVVFQTDSINTSHPLNSQVDTPASIFANFDFIAYNKGACIIRFLIKLIGEDNFKTGINSYLTKLAYKNAFPHDLWDHMTPYVPENLIPEGNTLTSVMDTWVDQAGYPVITFNRYYNTGSAKVTQNRFLTIPTEREEKWVVPLTWTFEGETNFNDIEVKAWLMGDDLDLIDLQMNSDQWIIINVHQIGYYRVNYDVTNWQLISKALQSNVSSIHSINRAQLVDDALVLARANLLDYVTALDTTAYLNLETEYVPWLSSLSGLRYLGDRLMYDMSSRELYQWYVMDKVGHMYDVVDGYNVTESDSHIQRRKRSLILGWICGLEDEECNIQAMNLFSLWKAQMDPDKYNPVDPDLKSVVYCAGMRQGDKSDFQFLFKRYENAANFVTEQTTIIDALGCSVDPELLNWYLNESIHEDSSIPSHDARSVITAVYNNYLGVDIALDFLLNNFQQASKTYGGFGAIGKVFSGISSKLNTKEHKDKLVQFRDESYEIIGEAMTAVDAAISTLDEILTWHNTHKDVVLQYFKDKRGDNGANTLNCISLIMVSLQALVTVLLI